MVLFMASFVIGPWNGHECWYVTWTHGEIMGNAKLTAKDDVDGRRAGAADSEISLGYVWWPAGGGLRTGVTTGWPAGSVPTVTRAA